MKKFLSSDAATGVVLVFATLLAMLLANSGARELYEAALAHPFTLPIPLFELTKPTLKWINDGLMVFFFLLVGLEIKRELICGHLSSRSKALLPLAGALGGVVLPAILYTFINGDNPATAHGWAIASATDIAFVVGLLAFLAGRIPPSLVIFIVAVAVIDDLCAILIIAFFYSGGVNLTALAAAAGVLALLVALNRLRVAILWVYLFVGVFLWLAVLKSGIHATIAGVLLGMVIPFEVQNKHGHSLLLSLEHAIKPYIVWLVLPIFALANAGVALDGMSLAILLEPVPLAIIVGLFFGKQLGIFAASWLLIKAGFSQLPEGASWKQFYAICIMGGIGFTMSLFIGMLAFDDPLLQAEVRLGVLSASLISALVGFFVLHRVLPKTLKS